MKSWRVLLWNAFPKKLQESYGILPETTEIGHVPPLVGPVRGLVMVKTHHSPMRYLQ